MVLGYGFIGITNLTLKFGLNLILAKGCSLGKDGLVGMGLGTVANKDW